MNRDRAKELAPIIAAFGEGKEIQCRSSSRAEWVNAGDNDLSWYDDVEYRIKTEPREWIVYVDDQGQLVPAKHVTTRAQNRHCFKVREVLE